VDPTQGLRFGLVFIFISSGGPILALATGALVSAGKFRSEALAILSDAPVVLAGAPEARFLHANLEGVRTLFETELDGQLALTSVVFRIGTFDASARCVAGLAGLEARAVELEAPRPNAVAGNFTGQRSLCGILPESRLFVVNEFDNVAFALLRSVDRLAFRFLRRREKEYTWRESKVVLSTLRMTTVLDCNYIVPCRTVYESSNTDRRRIDDRRRSNREKKNETRLAPLSLLEEETEGGGKRPER